MTQQRHSIYLKHMVLAYAGGIQELVGICLVVPWPNRTNGLAGEICLENSGAVLIRQTLMGTGICALLPASAWRRKSLILLR
jgi:hypothetical protein